MTEEHTRQKGGGEQRVGEGVSEDGHDGGGVDKENMMRFKLLLRCVLLFCAAVVSPAYAVYLG